MTERRLPRFLTSVSTKLLIIIMLAGIGINVSIILFLGAFQYHAAGAFVPHLTRYVDYLIEDLGTPPDQERAKRMATETGMVITYESDSGKWATATPPERLYAMRKRLSYDGGRIQIESRRGSHVIYVQQPEGRIGFYLCQPLALEKKLKCLGIFLLALISTIMLLSFLVIRWVLRPLKWLKQGVDAVGRGKLSHRVPLKRRDELRDLAQAFNEMTERLGRLIKAKEQLLLDVSHELRTPITRIKVALAILPDDDSMKGIAEDLEEIEAKITELLETARSLGVKSELNRSSVNLGELIRDVAKYYADQPPGIKINPMGKQEKVMLDREQISKALKNIIDNAIKYSLPESNPIEVSLTQDTDEAMIVVRDFGMGIPAADLDFVFEPFYRVDKARTPKNGYGLGLSLVKTIVTAHNGHVELSSTLGKGTLVQIYLPISQE
jgi:signal transduction histidine kinase